ncbi:unnamed protein product [Dracunculus medinensis]|uniref:AP complex mu/sigma subunit domain-containing protein n=1 Tax=Dracunculus medinensis TaxID=318479 RepID=A0A0N4U0L8_DRAME|nr:unnamed protein product [Dracunculus medinensis]
MPGSPLAIEVQVHHILSVMGGMVLETNMNEILLRLQKQEILEKQELTILKVPSEFDYDTAKNYAVDVTSVDSLATKEQIRWRLIEISETQIFSIAFIWFDAFGTDMVISIHKA